MPSRNLSGGHDLSTREGRRGRFKEMSDLRDADSTYVEIGRRYDISAKRVRRILNPEPKDEGTTEVERWLLAQPEVTDGSPSIVRIRYAFRSQGIETLHELCQLTEAHLLRAPNFGRRTLLLLRSMLARDGLSLGGNRNLVAECEQRLASILADLDVRLSAPSELQIDPRGWKHLRITLASPATNPQET
jgi:hypothetical protein